MQKTNRKTFLMNIMILLVTLLLFFLIFEVTLRAINPKPKYERGNEFSFYEYDELLGWKNKANSSGEFYMPDSVSTIEINSKGLRDVEHSYIKKSGIKRIQFYGDSFTWGYGVNASSRFTEIFAKEVKKDFPNIEVINLGTTGYGTDQQYLQLKSEGLKYHPDVVIIAYHNDLIDISSNISYTYPRPHFILQNESLVLENVPVPKREYNWTERINLNQEEPFLLRVDKKLRFFNSYVFILERLLSLKSTSRLKNLLIKSNINESLIILEKLIIETNNLAKKNNAKFIILLIPDRYQVYGEANTFEIDYISYLGDRENITIINPLQELRDISKQEKRIYFEIDGHFSEKGHKIFGELVAKEFIKQGF